EDAPKSLDAYGLTTPYLTVSLTTEEKKPIPQSQPASDAASQPSEQKFETITKTYGLLVGGFANLENSSRFIKLPDQPWVATAPKDTLERLVPKEVRDTKLTRVKADLVNQLELTTADASAILTRQGARWVGTGDLADLDEEAVKNLLQAVE